MCGGWPLGVVGRTPGWPHLYLPAGRTRYTTGMADINIPQGSPGWARVEATEGMQPRRKVEHKLRNGVGYSRDR